MSPYPDTKPSVEPERLRSGLRRQEIVDLLAGFGYEQSPEPFYNEQGECTLEFRHRLNDTQWFRFTYYYDNQGDESWVEGELTHHGNFKPEHCGTFSPHFMVRVFCLHFREDLERIPDLEKRMLAAAWAMQD